MKKTLILGLAALATASLVPLAEAGEVKLGGNYFGRWQAYDANMIDEAAGTTTGEGYVQDLQLNMDMIASEKSHAHMRVLVLDSARIEGADLGSVSPTAASDQVTQTTATAAEFGNIPDPWEIRQAWLETEAWGIGIKFGEMPLSLNDSILVGDDLSSNGGLLLSKTFGDITAVVGNIRINEDMAAGASSRESTGANSDDANLWAASLFGKAGLADYNLTLAYADIGKASDFMEVLEGVCVASNAATCATTDGSNLWVALTLSGKLGAVNAVATGIYENGYDLAVDTTGAKPKNLWEKSGMLGALRLNGSTPFGEWNSYGFIATQGFNNITNDNMIWSATWDQGGPGNVDLLNVFASSAGAAGVGNTSPSENMSGLGMGLKVKAGGWTINPMIDYAAVTKNSASDVMDSAFGGSLLLSTMIQKDTTLMLEAAMIDPKSINNAIAEDNAYYAQAGVQLVF
ncbi:MAG: hypothetical protein HQL75_11530 [Magnetococcales bacterium]|nr:hypothetical protein [Magnetococcales bacterium]